MFHHEHVGRRHAPIPYPVIEMNEAGQKSWWAGGTKGTDASETLEKTLCAVGSDGLSASSFSTPQAMYLHVGTCMLLSQWYLDSMEGRISEMASVTDATELHDGTFD